MKNLYILREERISDEVASHLDLYYLSEETALLAAQKQVEDINHTYGYNYSYHTDGRNETYHHTWTFNRHEDKLKIIVLKTVFEDTEIEVIPMTETGMFACGNTKDNYFDVFDMEHYHD